MQQDEVDGDVAVSDRSNDAAALLSPAGRSPAQIALPGPLKPSPNPFVADQLLFWFDRHRTWLLATVFVVYLIGFSNEWRPVDDSATHMAIARSIADGAGFEHPVNRIVDVSPGLPFALAGMMTLFGKDAVWPAHLAAITMAMACLWMTYTLIKLHAGRPTAVLVTVGLGLTECFYQYAFSILTDLPFLTGALMFLLGYEWTAARAAARLEAQRAGLAVPRLAGQMARAVALMAAGIVLMACFRYSPTITFMAAVVVTACTALVRKSAMPRWNQIALCGMVIAAVLMIRFIDPSNEGAFEQTHDEQYVSRMFANPGDWAGRVFGENLPDLFLEETTEAVFAIDWGEIMSVPLTVFVLVGGVALLRERRLWGVMVLVFLAQWVLTGVTARYFLVLMPLLVFGWWRGSVWVGSRLKGEWPARVIAVALLLWLVPNVIKIGEFIVVQHREPFLAYFKDGKYQPQYELGNHLRDTMPADVLVVSNKGLAGRLSCFSDRHVRSFKKARAALKEGRPVYILEPTSEDLTDVINKRGWQLGEAVHPFTTSDGAAYFLRPLELINPDPSTNQAALAIRHQ